MPDELSPEIAIVLDKERHLKFGIRAMRAFEKETGKNLLKAQTTELTATEISVLLWACLLHEDKELTLDTAIDLIDKHSNLGDIAKKLAEAQEVAVGKAAESPLVERPPTG